MTYRLRVLLRTRQKDERATRPFDPVAPCGRSPRERYGPKRFQTHFPKSFYGGESEEEKGLAVRSLGLILPHWSEVPMSAAANVYGPPMIAVMDTVIC